jgi:outer membrane translocation and assembly module TamA
LCPIYAQKQTIDFDSEKKSKTFEDSLTSKKWLDNYIIKQQKKGYAKIQYAYSNNNNWRVTLGNQFNIDSTFLNGDLLYNDEFIFNHKKNIYNTLNDSIQKGYPFFGIKTDSIIENNTGLSVYYSTSAGPKFVFGKVNVGQSVVVKSNVLKQLMHWKTGHNFKLNQWSKATKQLTNIPYVTLKNNPTLQFIGDSVNINISLAKKKVNQFDAIIGFQPKNNTDKTEVIADVNLQLYNLAKRTDTWKLRWSTPESATQKLNASTTLPLLFNTPFGYSLDVFLLKQDSTYIHSNIKNGVVFTPSFNTNIIMYTGIKKINPIGENINTISTIKNRSFGLKLNYQQLNNLFNPIKGWQVSLDISQGKQNNVIQETTTKAVFNAFQGSVYNYLPISKKIVLKQSIDGGSIATKGTITQAELFEIGGFSSFRGVNERFIRSSDYIIYSLGPRYRLDEFSYLELFYDNIWFTNNQNELIYYWTLGTGFAFSTKGGIFSLSYALSDIGNGLEPKTGKIHFGYINLF